MRALLLASVALLAAAPAFGQAADPAGERLENSPRHHEWANIAAPGDRTVRTFVVYPEVDEPVAAVVIIHENPRTDKAKGGVLFCDR